MGHVDTDALRRVAERVETTAREQGAEGQAVIKKDGILMAAIGQGAGKQGKALVPWDEVGGADFEQKAQEAFNQALATSLR